MLNRIRHFAGKGESDRSGVKAASVLVPVTGARYDGDVVRLACELLESNQSSLHILYVIEVSREHPLDAPMNTVYMSGERVLSKLEEIANEYKCEPNADIVQVRKAGAAIVREAVFKEVDTIVMGSSYQESYGHYSLDERLLYVLRHSPCRVIISRDSISSARTRSSVSSFESDV